MGEIPAALELTPTYVVIKLLNEIAAERHLSGVINLKLVDDKTIQALNDTYSGNDYATDVLTFSYIESMESKNQVLNHEPDELGDMLISIETAQRQADVAGTTLADELATLVLHGVLHIFGYDHAEPRDREAMDLLQSELLQQANVTYRNFNWA